VTDREKPQETQPSPVKQPVFLLPGVVTALAGLMVAVHIAASFLDPQGYEQLIIWFGFLPFRLYAFPDQPGDLLPLLWTPVTHGFLHANWEHLIINTAWLAIFATPVARRYGARATVGIFLLAAVAGAAAFTLSAMILGPTSGIFLIGASGGVAGLTGAATRFIFQPVLYAADPETGAPVPAGRRLASLRELFVNPRSRWFTIIWVFLNAVAPLLPIFGGVGLTIAWQAHLGGFFAGLLLVPLFERRPL
jgi:membrane associated rhomboid family serine protease